MAAFKTLQDYIDWHIAHTGFAPGPKAQEEACRLYGFSQGPERNLQARPVTDADRTEFWHDVSEGMAP